MTAREGEALVSVGDVIAGKYRVEAVVGKGGMGLVLAVTHLELGEKRAIKLLLPQVLQNEEAVHRFVREAKVISRLRSRHVVQVFDVGNLAGGAPYIVMEFLEGTDLESIIEQRKAINLSFAVNMVLQAMEAVAEAHSVGIVHRDLKPANLFVAEDLDGTCVKVLDFGISKLSEPDTNMRMTATDVMMGTPYYMSPEQITSSRDVDHRTDIWSLGVVLYELVTGTLPFAGATVGEQCKLLLTTSAPPVSSRSPQPLPPGFEPTLMRFLACVPTERYATLAEAARALRPFATDPDADRYVRRIERALARGDRRSLSGEGSHVGPAPPTLPIGGMSADDAFSSAPTTFRTEPEMALGASRKALPGRGARDLEMSKSTRATWHAEAAPAKRSRMPWFVAGTAAAAIAVLSLVVFHDDESVGPAPATAAPEAPVASAAPEPPDEPAEDDTEVAERTGETTSEEDAPVPEPTAPTERLPQPATKPAPVSTPKPVPPRPAPKPTPPKPAPGDDPFGSGRH